METYSPTTDKFKTPQEEISYLRERIAEKEKELSEKDFSVDKEKVIENEISRYRGMPAQTILHDEYKMSADKIESIVLDLSPEKHDSKMEELLAILKEKGIKNAMSVLSELKDPHIEDDFHRFLVQYINHGYPASGLKVSKEEFRGVGLALFEISLPEDLRSLNDDSRGSAKPLKELVSSMEQFFAGMLSIANKDKEAYMVLEIAKPLGSGQVIFYAGVPKEFKELFQNHLLSIYHNAKITEATNDYNIFNQGGFSLGSSLSSKENPIYPVKTYENFDHDPLNVLINAFSKMNRESEGAAVQVIFAPKGDYYQKRFEYAITQIEGGMKAKEAVDMPEGLGETFIKGFADIFKPGPKPDEEKKVDSEAISKIRNKLTSTIVAVNIRLLASAGDKNNAEKILQGLESGFNQFSDPTSNSFKSIRAEKGKLRRLFRDFSFRVYNPNERLPLNLRELTSIVHFQNLGLSPTPQLKQIQTTSAPVPDEMYGTEDGIYLGLNNFRNSETKVYIRDEDRLRHLYIIGQTGTGKSVFLRNMIEQDIRRGNGLCYVDPHGMDILKVLASVPPERFQDVIYFDPSHVEQPMALNMLEYDPAHPEQKTFVVNELFSIFQKLYGAVPESMGPMFEQYFRNATMLVIEDPSSGSTLLDVSRVMANKAFRELKISRCKNPVVVEFWKEVAEKAGGEASLANMVPYITSKFDVFLANEIMRPIIAQEKSSFNFRDIMDNKKILLVNLSKGRLGDINSNLIGLILVGKILMAALSRNDIAHTDFPPFYLYIDEFQNITTDSIATILSEARKYKLSLTIAHQFIAQLQEKIRDAVFGNVGSVVSFRTSAEDSEYLEKIFAPVFSSKDIMNLDNLNAVAKILVGGKSTKAFNFAETYPPKGDPQIVETLKQLSYITYGGDRAAIEEEILKKYKKTDAIDRQSR